MHIPRKQWFLSLSERLHWTINALTMQYFTYNWQCIYSTHSEFCSCWYLVVCKLAVPNEWSECPSPESVHARTTSDYGLLHPCLKVPGAVAKRSTGTTKKCVGVMSPHFELELDTLGVLSVLTDQNRRKGLRSGEQGGCTSTVSVCRRVSIWNLFIVLVWGNSLMKFVRAF